MSGCSAKNCSRSQAGLGWAAELECSKDILWLRLPGRSGAEVDAPLRRLDLAVLDRISRTPPMLFLQMEGRKLKSSQETETDGLKRPGRFQPRVQRETFQDIDYLPSGPSVRLDPQTRQPETYDILYALDRSWEHHECPQIETIARDVLKSVGFITKCGRRIVHQCGTDWFLYEDTDDEIDLDSLAENSGEKIWGVHGEPPDLDGIGALPGDFILSAGGQYGPLVWSIVTLRLLNKKYSITKMFRQEIYGRLPLASEPPTRIQERLEGLLAEASAVAWQLATHLRGVQVQDIINRDGRGLNWKYVAERQACLKAFALECRAARPSIKPIEIADMAFEAKSNGDPRFSRIQLIAPPNGDRPYEQSREITEILTGL